MRLLLALLALSVSKVSFTQPETYKTKLQDSLAAKQIDSIINSRLTNIPLDSIRFDSTGLNPFPYSETYFFLTEKRTDRMVYAEAGSSTSITIDNKVREMIYKSTFAFIKAEPARAEIWISNQKQCAAYFANNRIIYLWVLDGQVYEPDHIINTFTDLYREYFRIKLKLKR